MASTLTKTKHSGIYLTNAGTYRIVVTIKGVQRKATAPNIKEAKRIRTSLLSDASDGLVVTGNHTVTTYFEQVWSERLDTTVRRSTAELYRRVIRGHFLTSPIANTRLRDLTAPDIRKVQEGLSRKIGRGSVETYMSTFKAMLSAACEDGLMSVNPAKSVKAPPKPANRDRVKVRALSDAEVTAFFAHVPEDWRLFFEVLLLTGLRRAEIVALRWSDVEHDRIHVRRQWVLGEFTPPKSGRSRTVPISEDLYGKLTLHHKATTRQAPEDLVFGYTGRPLCYDTLSRKVLLPTYVKAGIKRPEHEDRIGYHAFRHTAVSTWLRHPLSGGYGWSLKDASRVAGHSSTTITEGIYWHFFDDELPTVPTMGIPAPTTQEVAA